MSLGGNIGDTLRQTFPIEKWEGSKYDHDSRMISDPADHDPQSRLSLSWHFCLFELQVSTQFKQTSKMFLL